MLPFKTNVKIFIIEYVCAVLLQTIYAVSISGLEAARVVLMGLLPAIFMVFIALKIRKDVVLIRCMYLASITTFVFMCLYMNLMSAIAFLFLAMGVTIALFINYKILMEYFIVTLTVLLGIAGYEIVVEGSNASIDIRIYITYMMMYAFAFVALLFIVIGVNKYKEEMEEKNEVAKEALNAKSNFLANMSHEIRTPMNAIYGMAELLEEKDFPTEEKNYIAVIKNSSENLLSIINEILDFSKVDSGKMTLDLVSYSINNMLNDVISIIRFRLRDKNVEMLIDIDPMIPSGLIGDEIRIKQILINVLNNAVKFTNRGNVMLRMRWKSTSSKEGILKIAVEDTGIGISPENIEKLFTAFGQLDTKKNRNVEGTGLGLAIVKDLIDLMEGNIRVESILKKGSTFYIDIPQKISDLDPCDFVADEENVSIDNDNYSIPFIAPKAKVMIVDDNKVNLQVAKELMKLFGFEATLVESGQEAIDKVDRHLVTYDLIFMDHMMPFMDGVEATKQIRAMQDDYAKRVPIVALTANAIKGVEEQFEEAGMNDYLSKPIKLDALAKILSKWIPLAKQFSPDTSIDEIELKDSKIDYEFMNREEILECLEGVDTKTGIKNCAGSINVYFDLLQTFAASNMADTINKYYESEDLENYCVTVHAIKGAAKNIAAHDIADKAYSLERAAKRGDVHYIWDNHDELIKEYTDLVKLLKQIFFGTK